MKRKIFFCFVVVAFCGLSLSILQSYASAPVPVPEPEGTTHKFIPAQYQVGNGYYDYYAIKFSVYGITQSPYANLQEGPFNVSSTSTTYQESQYMCLYTTSTYATIWVKVQSNSSWTSLGSISMNLSNTVRSEGNVILFTINMGALATPIEE